MKHLTARLSAVTWLTSFLILATYAFGQVSVLTQHNDTSRTGQNLSETVLNTGNVNQSSFGKLFWRTVDGYIYAQPLYIAGLNIQGITRNVVYVATEHNSVYAFDADDPSAAAPLWQVNLGTPVPMEDICIITGDTNSSDCPYFDISPEIGITSTPVIDPVAGIIFVVARTKNTSDISYHYFLHALDLASGAERLGGPIEITGQVSGNGPGSQGGVLTFDATFHNQRPALLLANGVIYVAFGSVGDIGTFHGWIMTYDATTLQPVAVFSDTPNGSDGGIWQSGQGVVADAANNVYVITGNGDFDANVSGGDYGDSFVKFSGPSLAVADYFTPSNQGDLSAHDTDLGAGGPMLLPGTSLLVGMGKDHLFRVVDTTPGKMGEFNSSMDNDVQEFAATTGPFFSSPIYWNSPNNGPVVYVWGPGDFLKAYQLTGSQFQTSPISQSTIQNSSAFSNAAALSVSANGNQSGSGIVWSSAPRSGKATGIPVPGVVRAFDATNLTNELWDSTQNLVRDDVGQYAKFNPPTIANGKVYVASFSGQLQVYGLNPPSFQGIQFVQVAAATPQSSTTSVPIAYPGAQAAGDLNVVIVGWNDSTSTVKSVTDSAGNNYALAIGPTTGTGVGQSVYYAKNIAGNSSNTVTVIFNQKATAPDVRILEYSGVDTSNPLDVSAGTSGNSNIADSGSVATNAANELVVGANMVHSNTTIMAGAPFNIRTITSPDSDVAADRAVNVPGNYHSWAPLNASGPWVMQVVTFRALAGSTAPFVSGVSPNNGSAAGGTAVTISGTNFAAGAGVTFGGTAATNVVVTSNTTITATTPAGSAGGVPVTVTVNGQSGSLVNGFTYVVPPTVTSVTPNSGTTGGGTAVTIRGTNFAAGAGVTFGGTAATNVVVTNSTTITGTTPAGSAGAVTVTVTNPGVPGGSLANGYTYVVVPTVTGVAPSSGTTAGGTAVTISGTNFAAGAGVTFGATAATNVVVTNSTTITATTPAGNPGATTVVVTVNGQSGSLANGFTYNGTVAIGFAQVAAATPQSPTATVALAYPGAQTAGNLNVVVVGWNDTSATVQSVKDSAGNNYSLAIGPTSGTALRQSIYYAPSIVGGSNTVTVTFSQAAVSPDVRILEYRGVTTLDAKAGASGNSTAANSGAATTTSANELVFGANTVFTGNKSAGSGFTTRIITSPDSDIAEDKVVTTAGSNSATATLTSSGPWVMQMVTFSAVSGPVPTVTSVSPNNGSTAGGTAVTINGTNFAAGAGVTFGATAATNVVVTNSTTITATTPAGSAGAVTVTVTNPGVPGGSLANGYTYVVVPTVTGVAPSSGTTAGGTAVTISGTNFAAGAGVTFGGTAATNVVVTSNTTITATTPAGSAGGVPVTVTVNGQSGSLVNGFTYVVPPTVTSVTPNSGTTGGGTAVTIRGTNFAAGAGVTFGGTAATNVVVTNSTTITGTTPAGSAGAVTVTVTNPGVPGGSLANGYTYVVVPTVTGVAPNSGTTGGGTAVTISGTNFAAGAGVTFGGTAATNVVVTGNTTITATTPAGSAGAVTVTVTVNGQSGSLTNGFSYVVQPTVSIVSPNNGTTAGGTAVTISGTNFAAGAGVTFGGTAATNVVVTNSTTITATTPAGSAGAVTVTVTVNGQNGSLTNGYTYVAPPTVSGVAPSSGTTAGGTVVTISGTNFAAGAGVTFGATAATNVVVTNSTTITATTPAGSAGGVPVTVTVNGQSGSLVNGFTYVVPPTVTSVTPNSGTTGGGTAVTIRGTNFAAGAGVTFGGTAATNVVVTNSTTITGTTPAGSAGAVTVTVTNPGVPGGSLANGYTYVVVPTVTGVAPNSGTTGGGTAVTINGTNFGAGAGVTFGGTAATNVVVTNSTTITATTPAGNPGATTVVVTVNGQSGSLANGFTYNGTVAIGFAQVAAATPQSPTATVALAYPGAQTAGNLNVVVVGWNDTSATVQSVKDSAGNNYSVAIGPTSGTALRQSIYYAPSIVGGSNTVTVTFSQAAVSPDVRILEYRGVTTLDAKAGASGNNTAANSGAATTTSGNELIIGANTVFTGNKSAGSGFTTRIITVPDSDIAEDKVAATAGSNSATATLTSSGPWVMQMVTFK